MIIFKYKTHKYGNSLKQNVYILYSLMEEKNSISDSQLQKIKERISKEVNPKSKTESFTLLADSKLIEQTMQKAADKFKQQVGRNMTYSEIREMMG